MEITNPEKKFKSVPAKLSGHSKITFFEKEYLRGVILDSPEEFANALIVYGGGSVPKSRATQTTVINAVEEESGGMAAAMMMLATSMQDADSFTKKLAEDARTELKSTGRFNKSYEYTFNNFQKTTITGTKMGEKYVLELCAAYVGSGPEKGLANTLNKPMGLVKSSIEGKLSIVDDWWFNLDLESALKGLPAKKIDFEGLAQHFASGGYSGKHPEITFEHKHKKFSLSFRLDAASYLRPEGGVYGDEYMRSRGKSVVGGAWTVYAENGNDQCPPRTVQPSFIVSASLPNGERAVTESQIRSVQSARDHLLKLMEKSKGKK